MHCLGSCRIHIPAAMIHAIHTCLPAKPVDYSCPALVYLQYRVRLSLPAPALSWLVAEAECVRIYCAQALRKGGRVMRETVSTAATLKCIDRLRRLRPPCRLHLQLSLYRVGAAEVKSAQQHQQLSSQVLTCCMVLESPFKTKAGFLCKRHML